MATESGAQASGNLASVTYSRRASLWVLVAMIAASIGADFLRPTVKLADERASVSLAEMVPSEFGDWVELPQEIVQVVNPQTQELLDRIYNEILARVYVDPSGYRIMLSLAYGSDQRGSLQAHKPEVCYPAQGFTVQRNDPGLLTTDYGDIPVRRIVAVMGTRQEPLIYWFTVGDTAVSGGTQKRLVDLRFGLTGRIPDGLLFRVSSIDADPAQAYRAQERFVNQLLHAVSTRERTRLSGLGDLPIKGSGS